MIFLEHLNKFGLFNEKQIGINLSVNWDKHNYLGSLKKMSGLKTRVWLPCIFMCNPQH